MTAKPLATVLESDAGIDVRPTLHPQVQKGGKVIWRERPEAEVHVASSGLQRACVNRSLHAADFCPFAGWPGTGSAGTIGSRMVVRRTGTGSGLEKR